METSSSSGANDTKEENIVNIIEPATSLTLWKEKSTVVSKRVEALARFLRYLLPVI